MLTKGRRDALHKGAKRTLGTSLASISIIMPFWFVGSSADAAVWRVTPRLEAATTYSDNVDLDSTGNRKSDVIFTVTPGVNVSGAGRRVQLNLDYNPSYFVAASDGRDQFRHSLTAVANVEVIKDHFDVDTRASVSPQFGSLRGSRSFSGANFTTNRRLSQAYTVNPRLRNRFGSFADAEVEYTYRFQSIEDPAVNDPFGVAVPNTQDHDVTLRINSGRRFQRLTWSLTGDYERTQRAADRTTKDQRAIAQIEYRIVRWLGLIGRGGYEEITDATLNNNISGATWETGLRFNPSRRTDVTVRWGKTRGAKRWSADASYTWRRWRFQAQYRENITTSQRIVSGAIDNFLTDSSGNFVDPFGSLIQPGDLVFGFINEAFERKRLQFDISYDQRRTSYTIRASREERQIDATGGNEEDIDIDVEVSRQLSRKATARVRFNYRRTDFNAGMSRIDNFYGGRVSYDYTFSKYVTGSLEYAYTRRDSNTPGNILTENVATIRLRGTF